MVKGGGSECDPRPGQPRAGPSSARAPFQATSPCAAQAPLRAGDQETLEGWPPGRPRALPFEEVRASVLREAG